MFPKMLPETITIKNPQNNETNTRVWYVNGKFYILVECYLRLEKYCQGLFNDNFLRKRWL